MKDLKWYIYEKLIVNKDYSHCISIPELYTMIAGVKDNECDTITMKNEVVDTINIIESIHEIEYDYIGRNDIYMDPKNSLTIDRENIIKNYRKHNYPDYFEYDAYSRAAACTNIQKSSVDNEEICDLLNSIECNLIPTKNNIMSVAVHEEDTADGNLIIAFVKKKGKKIIEVIHICVVIY